MKKYLLGLAAAAAMTTPAVASDDAAMGLWLVQSERAIVEIAPCGEKACGKIVWLTDKPKEGAAPNPDKLDLNNEDEALRTRPLCGLNMIGDFTKVGAGDWEDGFIYNGEDGKTYTAYMKVQEDGTLKLRGYVGIALLGKTQIWTRAADNKGGC